MWEVDPLVPVTLAVKVPMVDDELEHERVLLPLVPSVTLEGLSEHERLPEAPPVTVTVSETEPVNPFKPATVMVDFPEPPEVRLTEEGLAATEKSGTLTTVKVNATLCDSEPLVPVACTV